MSHCHHHHESQEKSIFLLTISFIINLLLSIIEVIVGLISGSIALIGDALHNTSDAFSILISIIAYQVGVKKANQRFTYGFKRAETIGGFVNLILLFISGLYLMYEGIARIITPEPVSGRAIIYVSLLALVVDALTAKFSHTHAHHNMNMKMLFIHNLADVFGSVGVIISGLFAVFLGWNFVDGIIAVLIAVYMLAESVAAFSTIVRVLMNAAPDHIAMHDIEAGIQNIKGVCDVHHMHLWCVSENDVSLECHVVGTDLNLVPKIKKYLADNHHIHHATIQLETTDSCEKCCF